MKKLGYIIGVDSDLPKSYLESHDITTFPFSITWKPLDNPDDFYSLMRNASLLGIKDGPKTSQPSLETLLPLYKEKLLHYEQVIVMTLTSHLSGTYNSAVQARKQLLAKDQERIIVFDSLLTSGAEGLLLMDLIAQEANGATKDQLILYAQSHRIEYHMIVTFDDPVWLERNGRLNPILSMVIKNLIKNGIRPMLTMKEGKLVPMGVQKNGYNKANVLFSAFEKRISHQKTGNITVGITHADCEQDAQDLKKSIVEYNKEITIAFVHDISPVLGAHIGPGGLVLSFRQL